MDIEKARRAAEATERVAEQQAQAQEWTSTMDAQARADEAAARDYAASLAADHATYLDPKIQAASPFARTMMTVVDSVRGLIRPVLTLYLVVLATGMFWWAKDLADKQGVGLKPDDLTRIISTIISTLLYLSTTTVVWWFGVRGAAKDKS